MKRPEEFVSKFRIINTDWSVWQYANYKCLDAEPTEPEYIYIYVDNDRALISRPFSVLSFRFVICGDHPTFPCVGLLSSHWCFTFSLLMVQMIHICRRVSSSMFARMKSSFRQSGVFFLLLLWLWTQALDMHRKSSLHRRCRSLLPARHWCTSINQWCGQRRHGR